MVARGRGRRPGRGAPDFPGHRAVRVEGEFRRDGAEPRHRRTAEAGRHRVLRLRGRRSGRRRSRGLRRLLPAHPGVDRRHGAGDAARGRGGLADRWLGPLRRRAAARRRAGPDHRPVADARDLARAPHAFPRPGHPVHRGGRGGRSGRRRHGAARLRAVEPRGTAARDRRSVARPALGDDTLAALAARAGLGPVPGPRRREAPVAVGARHLLLDRDRHHRGLDGAGDRSGGRLQCREAPDAGAPPDADELDPERHAVDFRQHRGSRRAPTGRAPGDGRRGGRDHAGRLRRRGAGAADRRVAARRKSGSAPRQSCRRSPSRSRPCQ